MNKFTNNEEPHVCYTVQSFKGKKGQTTLCNICNMSIDDPELMNEKSSD